MLRETGADDGGVRTAGYYGRTWISSMREPGPAQWVVHDSPGGTATDTAAVSVAVSAAAVTVTAAPRTSAAG
ncbi:hypothetical protein ACIRD6_27190 [Streptomyces sp. NPDC102473]|uniref:hypothetical protein n=1 Tax=Streptomyces sp. NPDC102473 TaxID=3366180 RepID=UPI0037F3D8FF